VRSLAREERWSKLIAPLQAQLEASGLARVIDFEGLRDRTAELGYCPAEDLILELTSGAYLQGYGPELVEQVLASAGVAPRSDVMPERWAAYQCEDYFVEGWSSRGYFDELSQVWIVVPFRDAFEDTDLGLLTVGTPGVDGISFGYRNSLPGLWAYYPIRGEFKEMAPTVAALVEEYSGSRLLL
jgi:hypothetical protein